MTAPEDRRGQLRDNLAVVRSRIDAACAAAGRETESVTLIAVTKFFPASDAAFLAELGVADLAESRDQEAAVKVDEFRVLSATSVRWHFVGRLQSNKVRSVARYADVVQSVDRPGLLTALDQAVHQAKRTSVEILIQISLDGDLTRGGIALDDIGAFAEQALSHTGLTVGGVMAIAPMDADPDEAFGALEAASAQLRAVRPEATIISAGMSGDLEAAVRHGATHVRIGTALLGRRDPTFG
jgi:pyridoxal phosphate enzyme (YggS family)